MTAEQRQPFRKIDGERRSEPLSDAKLGGLLAGLNKEHANILLVRMRPNQVYPWRHLDALLHQGGQRLWSKNLAYRLCEGALSDISLVTKQVIETQTGRVYGYGITDEGEDIGIPLAGHLLSFSKDHPELSFQSLLGVTTSPTRSRTTERGEIMKNRSPLNRFRILTEIATARLPMRQIDLVSAMVHDYPLDYRNIEQIEPPFAKHLEKLAKAGVITYTSIEADQDYVFYTPTTKLPEGTEPIESTRRTFKSDIVSVIHAAGLLLTSEDILQLLMAKDQRYGTLNPRFLKSHILENLALLSREGILQRVEGFSKNAQSIINLNVEQRDTVTEFVNIIERFRSGDTKFLADGRRKASEIASDPEHTRLLLEKAYAASSNTQSVDPAETSARILSYLQHHPGSSNQEIQTHLENEFGQKSNIEKRTKALERSGILISVRDKRIKRYSLSPEQEQPDVEGNVVFEVTQQL